MIGDRPELSQPQKKNRGGGLPGKGWDRLPSANRIVGYRGTHPRTQEDRSGYASRERNCLR